MGEGFKLHVPTNYAQNHNLSYTIPQKPTIFLECDCGSFCLGDDVLFRIDCLWDTAAGRSTLAHNFALPDCCD